MAITIPPVAPRSGISFHACRDGGILYDETRRRLYALNPAASLVWLGLAEGAQDPVQDLRTAFGLDPATARQWAAASLSSFDALGLLAGSAAPGDAVPRTGAEFPAEPPRMPSRPGAAGSRSVRLQVLDRAFELSYPAAAEPFLAGLIAPALTARAAPAAAAPTAIGITDGASGHDVAVDGWIVAQGVPRPALATCVEQHLVTAAVAATPHVLTLHAGLLRLGAEGVLLVGASGSGKSTLGAALLHAGWDYGGDELALLMADFGVRPVALGPCIKQDSFPLVERWFPEFRGSPVQDRYGRWVKFLAVESPVRRAAIRAVAFPRYLPGATSRAQSIAGLDGLARLLDQCVYVPEGFSPRDVLELVRWHERITYFDIVFSDAEQAARSLSNAVRTLS